MLQGHLQIKAVWYVHMKCHLTGVSTAKTLSSYVLMKLLDVQTDWFEALQVLDGHFRSKAMYLVGLYVDGQFCSGQMLNRG